MHPHSRGYTLIELLVVIFIISIVASVAMLSIHVNDNKRMQAFANEITQMLTLAEEQAMLQPAILGLSVQDQTLQFMAYQPTKKEKWIMVQDHALAPRTIPNGMQVNVISGGNKNPQIIISTNGDITPFTMYIGKTAAEPRFVIKGESDGNVIITNRAN